MHYTTTTAAPEAAKNLAIYNAIADHARHAFEGLEIQAGQYTTAQVVSLIKKSRAFWRNDVDSREVIRVEVDGFACSFRLGDVFAVLAKVATAYEVPTRDRATFVRAAEAAEAVVSFTIAKTAAAEVAKAVAKKDTLRPVLEFAYVDTARRALVGVNGHVMTVAPLSSLTVAEGARPGYLVDRSLLKSDHVTIDANNNATDGARVAESPDWLRFPAWASVFPAVYDTDLLTIDAKTRRALAKAVAVATKFAGEEPDGSRLVSIFGEANTSKIVVRSRRELPATAGAATRYDVRDSFIQLPAELSRSFALTFHGPDFAALPAFDKIYITPDAGCPVVFAGSHTVALLIPQPLPDDAERICGTDSRPAWAKAVEPLADLLAAAPAAATIDAPAADSAEVPADDSQDAPAEVIAAPAEDSIETPDDDADPEAEAIETPAGNIETPAALTTAAELLRLAEFRDAAKAIAKAKTADDFGSVKADRAARRLLTTAHGLTLTDFRIKTADGLTLARFIYTYGKKSRRTLSAPLLKVAVEFATLEKLADEWAELTAAATDDSIEPQTVEPTPVGTIENEPATNEPEALRGATLQKIELESDRTNAPAWLKPGQTFKRTTADGREVVAICTRLILDGFAYITANSCGVADHVTAFAAFDFDSVTPCDIDDNAPEFARMLHNFERIRTNFEQWQAAHPYEPTVTTNEPTPSPAEAVESKGTAEPVENEGANTPAKVIAWALTDELPTADGRTANTVTPADLLSIESEHAESERETTVRARAERRPLLLTIARHTLRLAAAAALLLLSVATVRTTNTLAAPTDLTVAPTVVADHLAGAITTADTLTVENEAESRAELGTPDNTPRPVVERHHARENKREGHVHTLPTVAPADSIADTLTADTLPLTADSIESDTLAAGSLLGTAQELTDAPADDADSEAESITTDDEPTDDSVATAESGSDAENTGTATNGHPHAHGSTPAAQAVPCSPSAPLAPVAPIAI